MARSTTRSNQRPDTLMQDRSPPARRNLLATHGRTIHEGHSRHFDGRPDTSGPPQSADIRRYVGTSQTCHFRTKRPPRRHAREMPCIVCVGRTGAGGVPRRPPPVACSHHRVERADRGPRHVSRTTLPRSPQRLPRPGNWNSLWYYPYSFCNCAA
jgi:hypothetical protein